MRFSPWTNRVRSAYPWSRTKKPCASWLPMKARASRPSTCPISFARSLPPKGTAPDWDCHWRAASLSLMAGTLTSPARWAKGLSSSSGCPSRARSNQHQPQLTVSAWPLAVLYFCNFPLHHPWVFEDIRGHKRIREILPRSCAMEEQQGTGARFEAAKLSEVKAKQAKVADAKLMSMSIAMFMAVVAMLGAVTAYRAALAEQETLRFERRLQQGEMLELVKRQELLSKFSSRTRYENSADLHAPAADGDREEAGKLAAPNRRQAALKKLQAEEEADHVRAIQPYLDYFYVDHPYDLEASIAMHSANWLRNIGFDTVWEAPAEDGSFPSIWEKLEKDVGRGQDKVMHLARAVVLFVVALALLTFAQLSHRTPKREKALAWIGGVLALAVLIMAWGADPGSWKAFAGFGVGFALLWLLGAPLARRFHFKARAEAEESSPSPGRVSPANSAEGEEDEPVHPAEVDPALFAGMRLHTAPVAHKFGRFVICMIAVSAVLSALSGFFYSLNAARSSEAIGAALENQAELFRMNSLQVTVWNYMVGRVATAEDHHLRYEATRQRLELAKEEPDLLSQRDATDLVKLKTFEEKYPEAHKLMIGPLGPEQDVHFPWKMVSQSYHGPAKAFAQWSANNEKSLGYQKKATTFLALLTLFAFANFYFALATHRANTPQLNESAFVSLISKKALDTVSQAEQQARDVLKEQGFAPPMDLVGDYGFDMYADGLVKGDRKRVEIGRQATLAAIDLDTNNLATRFNLGVAQLAEGHEKEALETYRQAIALGKPGKEPFVTDDAAVIGAVIGGAITDLDVFRQYCTGLNDAAYCKRFESTDLPRLKSELVTAAWPSAKGRTLAGSGIKLTDLHLRGSAAGLGWSGLVENLPQGPPGKEQDALAVLWYAYSPDWKAWRVLPAISVRVEPALYAQGYSRRFRSALRASDARICLQSGTYRAEFYVDGELAGSQEITLKDENLHPEMFPDLDVAICRPPSWQRWQSHDPDAVWIRGFIEDGENRGVFVFAFFDPQQDGKEVTEQRALRRAQNILHTEGLAPKPGAARPLSDCTGLRGRPGAAMAAFGDGGGASIGQGVD